MEATFQMKANEAVERFLVKRGYEIIARDWTCQEGTMDFIAKDEDALVFVEVKARSESEAGLPSVEITKQKRDQAEKIAINYLTKNGCEDTVLRFDAVSLVKLNPGQAMIRHHINAFSQL